MFEREGQDGAMSAALEEDLRFTEPLYTLEEAAGYLRVPRTTFDTWAHGYSRTRESGKDTIAPPVLQSAAEAAGKGRPVLPFIGLAQGMAVRALKDAGVPMREIREVVPILEREIGVEYALATRRLYVEGGRILTDYAASHEAPQLAVVRTQQGVFKAALASYLRLVTFDTAGYAEKFILPGTESDVVEVDPHVAFGKPMLIRGNARMIDLLDRFQAGDLPSDIAEDFEVPESDVMELIRVFYCAPRDS
jgi:uncharacterized protein (DUF433 family)